VPWAECDDAQRLDVHNGLLLSALWDAAFDTGLVSFTDDGAALASPELSTAARIAAKLGHHVRLIAPAYAKGRQTWEIAISAPRGEWPKSSAQFGPGRSTIHIADIQRIFGPAGRFHE
jgi:hypothetical protein